MWYFNQISVTNFDFGQPLVFMFSVLMRWACYTAVQLKSNILGHQKAQVILRKKHNNQINVPMNQSFTPPKFNSSPLKNDGTGRPPGFLLGPSAYFQGWTVKLSGSIGIFVFEQQKTWLVWCQESREACNVELQVELDGSPILAYFSHILWQNPLHNGFGKVFPAETLQDWSFSNETLIEETHDKIYEETHEIFPSLKLT